MARLNLDFGPARAGDAYRVALSFSHMPGIPLGGPYLHLAPDTLFALTAAGDVPGFTAGFSGTLDVWGRAMPSPSITIPRVPALQGVRVFCGAIAHSATRITAATNCYGATIQ